ncbi:MAG: type II toxin-antitoxin system RelE/ParE family toxin [Acidobacteria bacterium]|nr:type II toxin-antitoxin system RelE/ParE family toxin [Acidobacteriota bacterium]
MEYRVEFSKEAFADLNRCYIAINAFEDIQAARWFDRFENTIASLSRLPERCKLAVEANSLRHPIRQLLFGRNADVYRVLFEINKKTSLVQIITIRHGAMKRLSKAEYDSIVKNPN